MAIGYYRIRIFIAKGMVIDYWIVWVFGIVSVFRIQYGYRILQDFRIIIGKGMVNDYWIVWVFGIVSLFNSDLFTSAKNCRREW